MKKLVYLMPLLIFCGCAGANLSNIPFEPSIEYSHFKRPFTVAYIVPNELSGKIYRIDSGPYSGSVELGNKFIFNIYTLLSNKFQYLISVAEDDKAAMLQKYDFDLIVVPMLDNARFEAPLTGIGKFDFSCRVGLILMDKKGNKIKDLIVERNKSSAAIAMSGNRNIYQLAYNSINGSFESSLKSLERLLEAYINTNMGRL